MAQYRRYCPNMMKTTRIERILKLLVALDTETATTVTDLAALMGVSRRTVFRDFDVLRNVGVDCKYSRESKQFCLRGKVRFSAHTFSDTEALAIMMVACHMDKVRFLPDREVAMRAGRKLEHFVPLDQRTRLSGLLEKMRVSPMGGAAEAPTAQTFAALQHAILSRYKITVSYRPGRNGREIRFELHPYYLAHTDGEWHLLALDAQSWQMGSYRVSQMMFVNCSSSHFPEAPVAPDVCGEQATAARYDRFDTPAEPMKTLYASQPTSD